jgi:hypothetical protein
MSLRRGGLVTVAAKGPYTDLYQDSFRCAQFFPDEPCVAIPKVMAV